MNRTVSFSFVVAGLVLIVFGVETTDSFVTRLSRFSLGANPATADWLLVGGAGLLGAGLVNVWQSRRGLFSILNCPLLFLGTTLLAGLLGTSLIGGPGILLAEGLFALSLGLFLLSLLQREP